MKSIDYGVFMLIFWDYVCFEILLREKHTDWCPGPVLVAVLQPTILKKTLFILYIAIHLSRSMNTWILGSLCLSATILWYFEILYTLTGVWVPIYHSTADTISRILFIFSRAIHLSWIMIFIAHEISIFTLGNPKAFWNLDNCWSN